MRALWHNSYSRATSARLATAALTADDIAMAAFIGLCQVIRSLDPQTKVRVGIHLSKRLEEGELRPRVASTQYDLSKVLAQIEDLVRLANSK